MIGRPPMTIEQRFARLAPHRPAEGCWLYAGKKDKNGYGVFCFGRGTGKETRAHRLSYELHIGPIVPGKVVCHSCDTPACVNPSHLWLGSQKDNILDARAKGRMRGQQQTHCIHGHEFTPENTYARPAGGRGCRQCIRSRTAEYRKRVRP